MENKNNKRIKLLNAGQIADLYGLPCFTDAERHHYFYLNEKDESQLSGLHLSSRIHFILQLGYFRAKHQLFDFTLLTVLEDLKYIMVRYFPGKKQPKSLSAHKSMASNNQRILKSNNFLPYTNRTKKIITAKLTQSIRQLNNPMEMFSELLTHMEHKQLVIPSYSTLQDLVGEVIIAEENRLNSLVQKSINKKTIQLIDQLFTIKEEDSFYDLTLLKRYPKNFNFKNIQAELEKHAAYYPIYHFAKRLLPKLDISEQNIIYYGSLVEHYQVQSLSRLVPERRYFYLLCYAYHRFQKMNDQLIETLMHYVDAYNKEAKAYAKLRAGENNTTVKTKHGPGGKTLIYWFFNKKFSRLVFSEIQKRSLSVLSKDEMILLGEFLSSDETDKKRFEWEFHDENLQAMVKNLRPLVKVLEFQMQPEHKDLLEGFLFMQKMFIDQKSLRDIDLDAIPIEAIPGHLKRYIIERDQDAKGKVKPIKSIHPYRYEFHVYDQLNKNLSSNKIYANDTTQYKSFAADIKLKKTAKEKKQLLKSLDAPRLDCEAMALIDDLEAVLEPLIIETNKNIENGENKHIKIKGSGNNRTWTLPYQKKSDQYNNPFYDKLPTVNLADAMLSVNVECNYMRAFTNIKTHYSKTKNDINGIIACVIANATGLGTHKMADSSDLSYNFLQAIQQNLIRLETLREANDFVCEAFSKLPIYPHYNLGNLLHGSADGQKFKTRWDTFNSRHSSKYYGMDKGIAPYTLGINYVATNCIPEKGAHQHESHFLFELVQNDTSGATIERISTDTEGSRGRIISPRKYTKDFFHRI